MLWSLVKMNPLFPSLPTLQWLSATLILVVLPHVPRLAWWISLSFFVLVGLRYWMTHRQMSLPSYGLLFTLALLLLLGIFLSYGTWFGRDAGIGLLVALCGLKLLEMNSPRDVFLLSFLSYFLIVTNFLYSQSIPAALYMGVVMIIATVTLMSLSDHNNQLPFWQKIRLSTVLLLQALPLMLVLFILFPRVAGPFWSLPKDAHSGLTGLSDSMSIGDINHLTQSNEIAFRVKFQGKVPPHISLYWRGPVLWWTNGRDWKSGTHHYQGWRRVKLQATGQPIDYTVTLEPHNEQWLFALDLATQAPQNAFITPDYQILATKPVQQRMRYDLRSYIDYQAKIFTRQQDYLALKLPDDKYPRARALVASWQAEKLSPDELVQRALNYFNQQPFVYTLTPPLLSFDDPVDEFLFETRQGFCEHYAAAFTVLMRAAGIPARVVTGYLGGTVNPIGDYLIVRQRDAHAWSEVWLPEQGWVRIDPTQAVSPERIEQGIDSALAPELDILRLEINWGSDSMPVKIWQQWQNLWDAVNYNWNQWVLGYGPARQQQLLKYLGLKNIDWQGMTLLLVIIISSLLIIYAAWLWLQTRSVVRDPVQKIYQRFCQKLARRGYPRLPHEGPTTYAARISAARPDLRQKLHTIIALYVQTRYRSQPEKQVAFRQAVRQFRFF
jgi:transglutaminase-like putative cysteine protease